MQALTRTRAAQAVVAVAIIAGGIAWLSFLLWVL